MQLRSSVIANKTKPTNNVRQEFVGNNCFLLDNKNPNFRGKLPNVVEKELPKYAEAVEKFGEDFGNAAKEHFKKIIKDSELQIKDDGKIDFTEQSLLKRALDILLYPVKDMPKDLANAVIGGLKKISWLKNSSGLNDLFDKSIFKNRRKVVENKSNIAAIKHYFELLAEGNEAKDYLKRFMEGHTRFKPLMPNYNAEAERSINRIVTGLIPAFFLANDAYNLSMYMNNNKDTAKKEKKRRFNQEVARIGITATATFYLMSIFSKQCNKSIGLTAGITAGIVLVSEVIGRLMAGNPVLPVSVESAKKYAKKRNKIKQNNTAELTKPVENKPDKKGFLTLNNILKVLGGLVAFGFAVEKVSNIPKVSERLGKLSDKYKGLFTEKYTLEREQFTDLMGKLYENGFDKIVGKYLKTINNQKGETLTIGHEQNKWKYVLIHQILTFPARFIKDIIMLPYKKIAKPLCNAVKEAVLKVFKIKGENVSKDLKKYKSKFEDEKEITMLQNSIKFLEKIEHDNPEEFTRKVNEKLVSSFDNLTKSSYENSDLNVTVKTAASAVTTGFLIADNYNMVMIDSQGQDKDLAVQKAKERAVQRGTRLTYEAFILKMVLDMFKGVTSASLLGAEAVSGGLRVITEIIERKAVGLPLVEATREEIIEKDNETLNATGLKGDYFRAMAKITGKKPLSERSNKNS